MVNRMIRISKPSRRAAAIGIVIVAALLNSPPIAADAPAPTPTNSEKRPDEQLQLFSAFDKAVYGKIGTMKDPQANAFAKVRYAELAKDLQFPDEEPPATLDALLAYCGYEALKAADIERLDSDVLMDFNRLRHRVSNGAEFAAAFPTAFGSDDILSTRFFSPKTTDVSGFDKPLRYSWRKLRAAPNPPRFQCGKSRRGQHVFARQYLRSRSYQEPVQHPFEKQSSDSDNAENKRPMYWLVFGPVDKGGLRQDYSETSWDATDPDLPTVATADGRPARPLKRYFVPDGCVQCHGEQENCGKLNFLDSDHYQDRVEADNDFPDVGKSKWSPLFDAGQPGKAKAAFDAIRKLNCEIAAQNAAVDARCGQFPSIQTRAVENWLHLHESSDRHLPVINRGITDPTTGTKWDVQSETDRKLLPLLNRYCYRCHNAFKYDVFDKTTVVQNAGDMADRINVSEKGSYRFRMPQDRKLSGSEKKELSDLLNMLDQ